MTELPDLSQMQPARLPDLSQIGPKPITKQRSPWDEMPARTEMLELLGPHKLFRRRVNDGMLLAIVAEEPNGWHLSVSHQRPGPAAGRQLLPRYPSWDELTHARYELLPHTIDVVMHLPPPDEYVAIHDTCFHLHEYPPRGAAL